MKLTNDQKFTALKYRHEDQAKLLQFLTANDIKVFSSYLTLQLVFGGYLVTNPITNLNMKIGLLIIDIVISLVAFGIILRSFQRRREVAETIGNCNKALGFDKIGKYVKDESLNSKTKYRPWNTFYYIGIFAAVIGITFIIFSNGSTTNTKEEISVKTEVKINDKVISKKN